MDFSVVAEGGGYSLAAVHGLLVAVASLALEHGLQHAGFSSSQTLEHKLRSCGARAWLLHDLWDLPGPGMVPVSPALAGGFFTTEPLGNLKKKKNFFFSLVMGKKMTVLDLVVR